MNPSIRCLARLGCLFLMLSTAGAAPRPNIIFVLTDDLGVGDVGVFFQNARRTRNERAEPWHLTPQLDRMAEQGVQLRHHYCPAPVCAPSRASLLLGVHQGHANVRDNQFDKALENNHTLATVLKSAGYATAAIGKWGLQGGPGEATTGSPAHWPAYPTRRGFDYYMGYVRHRDGHAHYPKEDGKQVWENDREISADLAGCYTTDLFTARAKRWIVDHREEHPGQPFFLYLSYDTPHAKLQLPPGPYPHGGGLQGGLQWRGMPGRMINSASGTPDSFTHPDYANATWDHDRDPTTLEQPWPDVYQRYATDVRRIDECVGDLLQLLRDLKIDGNTLVIFTSDNGPSRESYLKENYEPTFFNSFGPHDGIKRDCLEGGIRVGALAHWPGTIPAARVSDSPSQFHDWMPTFAELAGIPAPARTDGVSLVPTLTGVGEQKASRIYVEYFQGEKAPAYPEFAPAHRGLVRRQMQALRLGDYMGVRYGVTAQADPFEIYDVVTDPQQAKNLAGKPAFAALQQELHETVLRVRRPSETAKRPYDESLVPALNRSNTVPGLSWRAYQEQAPWPARLDDAAPASRGVQGDFKSSVATNYSQHLFSGYLNVPTNGVYTFHLTSADGALLRVHEATVLDLPAARGTNGEAKATIRLQAGRHPFRLYRRTEARNATGVNLQWSGPGFAQSDIPASALSRDATPGAQP